MQAITNIEHQWIPMDDGIRLSARLWLPAHVSTEPVPAILEYIPYRKRDMVRIRDERNHPVFAQAGYAAIRVDMRGSGDSEGTMSDMYTPEELDDAVAVIEWIAQQSWCNGHVGMMGTSWGGTSSLQAASRKPAALKAIIAVCANNNRFDDDIHHMGGCLLTDTVEWGATLPAILASPPDPLTVGDQWRDIWMSRLEQLSFPLEHWIRHETRDEYWQWGSVNESPESITCPVLMIGGWADRYSNTVLHFIEQSRGLSWGIVGAWGHHYPDQANPAPGIAFQQEAIRWWDHWLQNKDNGIDTEPKLRVWMQEPIKPANKINSRPGRWIAEETWPSEHIQAHAFSVKAETLTPRESVATTASDIPTDLGIGKASGDTGYFGRAGGLPLDQREDDEPSLVFETQVLAEPIEILGAATLKVAVRRELATAILVVRLNDIHPDGSVTRVSYAVKNLALNERSTEIDGQATESEKPLTLQFHNTGYHFAAGHKIRVSLSSSYWPIVWPSPKQSRMTLPHESLELLLPVRPQKSTSRGHQEINFANPQRTEQTAESTSTYQTRSAPELQRWMESSDDNQTYSTHWRQPHNRVFFPEINLEFGYETTAVHRITHNQPNSAFSRFEHTLYFTRDDWRVKVVGTAELTATQAFFKLRGDIVVTENEQNIFSRQWQPQIKRECS